MIVYCLYIALFSVVPFSVFFFFFDNSSTFEFTFTLRINFSAENWSLFSMLSSGQEVRSEVYI